MKTTGIVTAIEIRRDFGKFDVVGVTEIVGEGAAGEFWGSWEISQTFALYYDDGVDMIDPTEMVKRNWLVQQVQRALADGLTVSVQHEWEDSMIESVTLHGPT